MVDVGNAVYLILKADSQVSSFVGSRIYPGPLPDTVTYPAIVRWLGDEERIQTLDPPYESQLVRTEIRLVVNVKSATREKGQENAYVIYRAIKDCFLINGKTYVYSISSPTEKLWIDGFSVPRNLTESFNETTLVWETGASWDIWHKPTY